jgi:hypothetical protein
MSYYNTCFALAPHMQQVRCKAWNVQQLMPLLHLHTVRAAAAAAALSIVLSLPSPAAAFSQAAATQL